LGTKLVRPSLTEAKRRLGKRLGIDIPLVGEHRLDDDLGAVAEGLHDALIFDHDHQAFGVDVGDDALAGLKPVETAILLGHQIDAIDLVLVRLATSLNDLAALAASRA
jgi:hypothetical protein